VIEDFNGDGNLDLALAGNDYGNEVTNGRYDAMNGLLLSGNGEGRFTPQSILQSGIYIPGDAKALVKLKGSDGSLLLVSSQNQGSLKAFRLKNTGRKVPMRPTDRYAILLLENGKRRKEEFYYGSSFLSQSARMLNINQHVDSFAIYDVKGIRNR
jgi:enediyne biosynthesis protein E4